MAQSWSLWPLLALLFPAPASSDTSLHSCVASYNLSKDLSLHGRSFGDGARLLAVSLVNSSLPCLQQCCDTQGCDLALLEEGAAGAEFTCFLVNCLSSQQTVCTFTPRPGYQTNSRFVPIPRSTDPFAPPKVDCTSPLQTGPCRAAFRRFFYDAADKTCKIFIYGGCLGNGNNFISEQACLEHCDGVTVNAVTVSIRSLQSLKDCSTPCLASDFRCGDGCCVSRNRLCEGTSQCYDKSDVRYCKAVHDSYIRLTGHQGSNSLDNEQCNAPKKVGNCRAAFPRWYFDTRTQTCTKFTYGGCKGNANNYESEHDCIAACAGHQEILPEPHKLQDKDYDEDDEGEADTVITDIEIRRLPDESQLPAMPWLRLGNAVRRSHAGITIRVPKAVTASPTEGAGATRTTTRITMRAWTGARERPVIGSRITMETMIITTILNSVTMHLRS